MNNLRTATEISLNGGVAKRPSEIAPFAKPKPETRSVGFHGSNRFRGLVYEEYLPALRGVNKVAVYQKMESDGLVSAMLMALELPVRAASWVVEAKGKDANAKRARDLVEDQLFNRLGECWENEVEKLLSYLQFGFEVSAKQWQIIKGEAVLTELRDLHPRTLLQGGKNWEFDADGHLIGVWQYGPTGETYREEFIPESAMLHLANRMRFGDPEGRSILRSGYKHWLIKDTLYRIDAIGKERGAIGTPVGKYDAGASTTDQDALENFVKNLHAHENGYGVFPVGTELENFSVELKTDDIMKSIQHHDTMLALSILAQFLMLGQEGNGGAYALSADQTDLFMLCLSAVADYVAARVNRKIIPEMVSYNIATDQFPTLSATISRRSASALVTMLRPLMSGANAPLTWSEGDEDWLREQLELPQRTLPRPKPVDPNAGVQGKPGEKAPEDGKPQKVETSRERIELPMLYADPPQFREEPAYAALGEIADQCTEALQEALGRFTAEVWRISGLSETIDASRSFKRDEYTLTPEQARALDAAIELFLTEVFGEDRTEGGFVGTASEDALLGSFIRLGHAVGINEASRLAGAVSAAAVTRESPQVKRVLTDAFRRLTDQGQKTLGHQIEAVREILTQGQERGANPLEVARELKRKTDGLKGWEAERLARTEMSFAANWGSVDEYAAQGVTYVEPLISALACSVCQAHSGKRIPILQAVPGVTIPPFHPHCLDSHVAVVE